MTPTKPLATLLALAAPAAALAGPLPLVEGPYVMAKTPCADPPFAAMRSYDGKGLGDPHSHDCRIRVFAHTGTRYVIDNSCVDVGIGPGTRSTERLTLRLGAPNRVGLATAFTVLSHGRPLAYRICPIGVTTPG